MKFWKQRQWRPLSYYVTDELMTYVSYWRVLKRQASASGFPAPLIPEVPEFWPRVCRCLGGGFKYTKDWLTYQRFHLQPPITRDIQTVVRRGLRQSLSMPVMRIKWL